MIGIENNLYPPETSTWMPAFIHTDPCRIYFSLSVYNTDQEIKNVQVVVNNQNTNASVLNGAKYPTGVMITDLRIDSDKADDDKYYVEIIPKSDIDGGQFEINQFYKVQIRFTGMKASTPPEDGKIAGWLIDNQKYFSEWSRVCLIKGISRPMIDIRDFTDADEEQLIEFPAFNISFVGRITWLDENGNIEENESERLKSYHFSFYDTSTQELVFDSGEIFANHYDHPNEINYLLPYLLEENIIYTVYFSFTTDNEYTDSTFHRKFFVVLHNLGDFDATITTDTDVDLGCINVTIKSTKNEIFVNNIVIRRASSETDFTLWEDVHNALVANELNENLTYTWSDYTIKSGVFYKYAAQTVDSNGDRSLAIVTNHADIVELEDMFLTRGNMQVRLRYDPNISSFKRTVSDSITETIGSKYPFFRRNGSVYYKQFPINGLITWWCDEEGIFLNKENIYKNNFVAYEDYNTEKNINEWYDYIYEREFREKVMDFLCDNTVKLFRSTTEGNILVRLMDVNFTPNQTLSRMLYSFSAMAYEIDECSIDNYNKYGVLDVGHYQDIVEHSYDNIGQLMGIYTKDDDLFSVIKNEYAELVEENFVNQLDYFRALKLEFTSEPYLIESADDGSLKPWTKLEDASGSQARAEDLAYGYIVYINNEPIIVSPRGIYELSDEGTAVTSIRFPVDTEVEFNYIAVLTAKENPKVLASKYYYNTIAGQLYGKFDVEESLSDSIYLKYRISNSEFYQKLLSIDRMIIEAAPGTIVYLKDMYDNTYYRHIIGPTGSLEFFDEETVIMGAYLNGIHLAESPEGRDEVRDDEYIIMNEIYNSFDAVKDPVKNGVYTIINAEGILTEGQDALINRPIDTIKDNYLLKIREVLENRENQYIYFNSKWYIFSNEHDVICPVDALIDYICETVKGEY